MEAVRDTIYNSSSSVRNPVDEYDELTETPVSELTWRFDGWAKDSSFRRIFPEDNGASSLSESEESAKTTSPAAAPEVVATIHSKADAPRSSTQRTKKTIAANKAAAEEFLNEQFPSWSWVTNWSEETPVAFADIQVDDSLMIVYFDATTGLPTAVEKEASTGANFSWQEDNSSQAGKKSPPTRLQLIAQQYVNEHYETLYSRMVEASERGENLLLPEEGLPEDRACWENICALLNDIAFGCMPVTVFISGDRLYAGANTADMFSEDDKDNFVRTLFADKAKKE